MKITRRKISAQSDSSYKSKPVWKVTLVASDAIESGFDPFIESFSGSFKDCLDRAAEYFSRIEENDIIDSYVSLESDALGECYDFYSYDDMEEQFPNEF